jgi:hypothetical protein
MGADGEKTEGEGSQDEESGEMEGEEGKMRGGGRWGRPRTSSWMAALYEVRSSLYSAEIPDLSGFRP